MLILPLIKRINVNACVVASVFIRGTDADSLKQPFNALGFVLAFTSSWHRYPHLIINRALPGAVREPKEPNSSKEVPQKEQRDHYTTLSLGLALKVDESLVHLVEALLQLDIVLGDLLLNFSLDVVSHRSEPGVQ